ncbi:solute carrier family 23 protein [Oryzicola mucosus]|uniref:Purine/pyrimidine permease n=1 Tax=Oryzicola mucosus TaxID=2767425 RepID=A0A8J6PIF0_9HYPH|nr:solute carrier family 23 protein [Oryzicola mucosus]MBD0415474.1 purine/pyrimidine permease [Oryzicola mucosus]
MIGFTLPPSRPRRRPQELSIAADEKAAWSVLLPIGFQHAAMALGLSAYVLALAKASNFDFEQTRNLLAVTIMTMAFGTALQAWGGKLGSGALIVHIPTAILIPQIAPIFIETGPGGVGVVTILCAIVSLILAPLTPRLRGLFPPIVAGLIVLIGGMSLVEGAFAHSTGLSEDMTLDPNSMIIAGITLGLIVATSVWGNRSLQLFSLLIGIGGGVIAAFFLGELSGGQALMSAPIVDLPSIATPVFNIPISALIAAAFVAALVEIDSIGSFILMDKMDDADWRRPDMKQAGRGILAGGIGDALGGLLGGMSTATSSANIGLCHASRTTTRYAGLVAAAMLLFIAFLPQATMALTLIPTPVIGAIEMYAAAFLIAAGIDLIAERKFDTRGMFIVGISMAGGVAIMLLPGLAERIPPSLRHLLGSGFIVTGVLAIVLNLLFRIGIKKTQLQQIEPNGHPIAIQVTDFIERMGGAWAARRDVVQRAAQASVEAIEAIQSTGVHKVTSVVGHFDELNFNIELRHTGSPLPLGPGAMPDLASILDADNDEGIDAAIASVSQVLIHRLADGLKCGALPSGGGAFLRLHFDH